MNFCYPLFDLLRELAWRTARTYSAVTAFPSAFRPQPRVRLDARRWRVRYEEPVGDPEDSALVPTTDPKS